MRVRFSLFNVYNSFNFADFLLSKFNNANKKPEIKKKPEDDEKNEISFNISLINPKIINKSKTVTHALNTLLNIDSLKEIAVQRQLNLLALHHIYFLLSCSSHYLCE